MIFGVHEISHKSPVQVQVLFILFRTMMGTIMVRNNIKAIKNEIIL